jgi:hypothetical protein
MSKLQEFTIEDVTPEQFDVWLRLRLSSEWCSHLRLSLTQYERGNLYEVYQSGVKVIQIAVSKIASRRIIATFNRVAVVHPNSHAATCWQALMTRLNNDYHASASSDFASIVSQFLAETLPEGNASGGTLELIRRFKADSGKELEYLDLGSFISADNAAGVEHHDSSHFAHSWSRRRESVEDYRKQQAAGKVLNKDAWANTSYGITGKTLLRYEREFPEDT